MAAAAGGMVPDARDELIDKLVQQGSIVQAGNFYRLREAVQR
jgi:hypothetical protein